MTEMDLKILRNEYIRKIYPSSLVSLILILIIWIYYGFHKNDGLLSMLLGIFALLIGVVVFIIITPNYRKDLKCKKVSIEKAVVEDKEYILDYEAGSASLPVSLLSILFIKKIAQREMNEVHIYSILAGGEKYYLDKINFDKIEIGSNILIRRTENTHQFLGIEAV